MKILYYNWTPQGVNGGGVAIYIENILSYVRAQSNEMNWDIVFLSSGYYYDDCNKMYIKRMDDYYGFKCYTIVNSPCYAPHGGPKDMYRAMIHDHKLYNLIDAFVFQHDGFDVIHFQSLEGLSPNVLKLKERYPNVHFIHTLHDYGVFCSNVKLWNSGNYNCYLSSVRDCGICMKKYLNSSLWHIIRIRKRYQLNLKVSLRERIYVKLYGLCEKITPPLLGRIRIRLLGLVLDKYRRLTVSNINKYVDCVLAVSKRVGEVAESFGICSDKIRVSYIGTKIAERPLPPAYIGRAVLSPFTILYMGYINTVKGAFLFLDMLDNIPDEEAKEIKVKFASKISDNEVRDRIETLKGKYQDIEIFDGYTHADFPQIFSQVDLGVVPPIWEDNLPQVAIETIANGVPVLTSCYGGAHELNGHPDFVFKDGMELQFKLLKIKKDRTLLSDYWNYSSKLTTMAMHIKELSSIYGVDK